MKVCFNYNQFTEHSSYISQVDEWNIVFNEKDTTLLEFLDNHLDKRINLIITDIKLLNFCEEISKKYSNVYINFKDIELKELKDVDIKFKFFTNILVNNIDTMQQLIDLKVTDIYIVEELGFELEKISSYLHKQNIQIRVFPNVAQSQWKNLPALKKFFIRPEDLEFYKQYIDTIEFFEADEKIDIYYDIYINKKKWFGRLDEIIIDFNSSLDNKYVIPKFAELRAGCRKKCMRGENCRRCDQIENLASSLEKSKLIVSRWFSEKN